MDLIQAVFIALLQGATELFPVSSLGHAVITPRLLQWDIQQNSVQFLPFLVALHFGSAIALLLYFWRDWYGFARGVLGHGENVAHERKLFALVCIATAPAAFLGFTLEHTLRHLFSSPMLAACFLIVNGFILFLGERIKHSGRKRLDQMNWKEAAVIGACQALALIPGISRSGATMVGGIIAGLTHKEAARFSFLLATPIILGASAHQLPKLRHVPHIPGLPGVIDNSTIIIAGIVAAIAAYGSVWFLMRYFKKDEVEALDPFAYYCWGVGTLSLVIMAITK